MSQYWRSDNVVKIGETTVSIPSDLGQSYTVADVDRRVSFEIPKSVKFLDGSASYLEFKMKINHPDPAAIGAQGSATRLQCDPAGAGMIVRNLRIYSGDRSTLIEEINEYNQLVALKHDYDSDQAMRQVNRLEQGGCAYQARCASTRGASQGEYNDLYTNPWFKAPETARNPMAVQYDVAAGQNTVKCCVPLKLSGVFSGEIWPNMLTGLYVELDMAPAPRIVKQLDQVMIGRRRTANPLVAGFEDNANNDVVLPVAAGAADRLIAVYLANANGVDAGVGPDSCPFCVGERIRFVSSTDVAGLVANTTTGGVASSAQIQSITVANFGGVAHVKLVFGVPGGAATEFLNAVAAGGRGAAITAASMVWSSGVLEADRFPVTYTITDMNLICHQVDMDSRYETAMLQKAREGSAIEFDIRSYTNYKNSIQAGDTQAAVQIIANNHKAKSIMVLPTDSTTYTNQQLVSCEPTAVCTADNMDTILRSARTYIAGIVDGLSTYQWQLNGVLQPSRKVSTRKIATGRSVDQFHLYELEKGLANGGIAPRSFKKFLESFAICRGMAVNGGAMDLRNVDITLLLDYSQALLAGEAARKNKMLSTHVHHVRRVALKGGSVEIMM